MKEVFKDIPNYEGIYQVSNLGRLKSFKCSKERILILSQDGTGYFTVTLSKNNIQKTFKIHQLVAMVFLDHIPNGTTLVINHINLNKLDNRVENLEIVTTRKNTNKKHLKSSSKYVGVYFNKRDKKWVANICINSKTKYLGGFKYEYEAHLAYQKELNKIN